MSDVQDYSSRLSDPASRKMETFSYLPELTDAEMRKQVEYIVSPGLEPCHRAFRTRKCHVQLLVYVETANVW